MTLSVERKKELVESLALEPTWHVNFIDRGPGRIEISTDLIPNSRYEGPDRGDPDKAMVSLFRREYMPEGADRDEMTFLRWVLYEYLWLKTHEAIEWFRYKEDGHPVFDAHESIGTTGNLLPPRPGEQWWANIEATGGTQGTSLPPDYWTTAQ